MPDAKPDEEPSRFQVRGTADTHFAWLRTRLAVERTLMSWVRTSTALIAFGFAIFQFLYRFNRTAGVEPPESPWAPWILSLALIGTGVVGLMIALWEYQGLVRYLWGPDFKPVAGVSEFRHHTPVVAVSVVLILIGLLAFVAVLLRVR